MFVSGAVPGDRVRAVVTKRKRAYAEARTVEVLEPSPERIAPRRPATPARRGRCCPTSASSRSRPSRSTTRCGASASLDGFELEPIVPAVEQWRYRNKLEYSFGTGEDGTLVCGFHQPGSWEEIVHVEDDLLASERVNAARRAVVEWCRGAGPRRLRPPRADGLPAQPRRPRGPPHRRPAGPPRHQRGHVRRRRLRGRARGRRRRAVLDADRRASPRSTAGGETDHLAGAPQLREELGGLELRHLAGGVLPDEHRDGRAALRRRRRVRRRCRAGSASTTCTAAWARSA